MLKSGYSGINAAEVEKNGKNDRMTKVTHIRERK